MQTCETCRHWGCYSAPVMVAGALAAHCAAADSDGHGQPETTSQKAWAVGRNPASSPEDGELFTRADFGCVCHEPKSEEAAERLDDGA